MRSRIHIYLIFFISFTFIKFKNESGFMYQVILLLCVLLPTLSFAQRNSYIGINLSPLLVNTLELRFEYQINRRLSFQLATGGRYQSVAINETPRIAPLEDYLQPENKAIFISMGMRFSGPQISDFPYISFDITHVHYWEEIVPRVSGGHPQLSTVNDTKLGVTATIGMVSRITPRIFLDVGIQFGYATPRSDLLAYYFPGMGYTTFGFSKWGVEGGHFQPILTLKYNLVKNRRLQLRKRM